MSKVVCELDDVTGLVNIRCEVGEKKFNKTVTTFDFVKSVNASALAQDGKNDLIKYISPLYKQKDNVKIIQVLEYESGKKIYFIQFTPKRLPILLYERFFDDVGLPNTIFAISVVNGMWGYGGKMICVKDDVISDETLIYHYPFSNANDNHICLGQNKFNFVINEVSVLDIPVLFFTMPNTKESFHPSFNTKAYDYDTMLRELSGKDFDNSLLVPIENKTYKDFVEGF